MFLALYRALIRLIRTLSKHTHTGPHTHRGSGEWWVSWCKASQNSGLAGVNLVAGCVFAFCSACFHASGVDVLLACGVSGACPLFSEEGAAVIIRAFSFLSSDFEGYICIL